MKRKTINHAAALLALNLALAVGAQADAGPAPQQLPKAASSEATGKALDALLAKPQSCQRDADCRSVAIGARACGGPEGYRAYSTRSAKPAKVEQLAQQHSASRAAANTKSGMVSTCVMAVDPGSYCAPASKTCELRPAGSIGTQAQ